MEPIIEADGTIDGQKYLYLMNEVAIPEIEAYNAPTPKAQLVTDEIKEKGLKLLDWLPYSDHPIENLFGIIKSKLSKKSAATSNNDVIQQVLKLLGRILWDNTTQLVWLLL